MGLKRRDVSSAILGGLAASLCLLGPSFAADIPVKAPPLAYTATPVWNWTGGYIGIHAGYGFGAADYTFPPSGGVTVFGPAPNGSFAFGQDPSGGAIGFQSGYNLQVGNVVFGIESGFTVFKMSARNTGVLPAFSNATYETHVAAVSSFTPRLGYAVGNWLFFGKLGLAYATMDSRLSNPLAGAAYQEKTDYAGWTFGLGVDYALTRNWVLGVEYNYYSFGSERFGGIIRGGLVTTGPDYNVDLSVSTVVGRLAYKFDGADPITAFIFGAAASAPPGPWSGIYAGLHVGYGWGDSEYRFPQNGGFAGNIAFPAAGGSFSHDVDGGEFGGHLGYMRQMGPWVLGTEGSLSVSGLSGSRGLGITGLAAGVTSVNATTELDWLATVTTRGGYVFGSTLAYIKGGAAFGRAQSRININTVGLGPLAFSESNDHVGWTLGLGLEYALGNWIVGLEYNYVDLGKERYGGLLVPNNALSGGQYDADLVFSSVLARVSYKFTGPGSLIPNY